MYAKAACFNDPFDCGIDLCDDITKVEKIQVLKAKMKKDGWSDDKITKQLLSSITPKGELNEVAEKNIRQLTSDAHKFRDNMGILSLSKTCTSILMWAHYAEKHKGICIEFTVPVSDALHTVTYSTDMPRVTLHDIYVMHDRQILMNLFTTKHKHWKYEKECRIILDKGDILHNIPGNISSIIFGLKTPSEDESIVRKVASSSLKNVKFRKCTSIKGKYSVKIENA